MTEKRLSTYEKATLSQTIKHLGDAVALLQLVRTNAASIGITINVTGEIFTLREEIARLAQRLYSEGGYDKPGLSA